MHQLSNRGAQPDDGGNGDKPAAILQEVVGHFEMGRMRLLDVAASKLGAFTVSDLQAAEAAMNSEMRRLHDELADAHQLMVHRFFLTAIHRAAVLNEHFSPHQIGSPERHAAQQAEYDELSSQISDMIEQVAFYCRHDDADRSRAVAASFMWSMAWWNHARRDVLQFVDDVDSSAATVLALGRRATSNDSLSSRIYHEAVDAERGLQRAIQGIAVVNSAADSAPAAASGNDRWGLSPHSRSHL